MTDDLESKLEQLIEKIDASGQNNDHHIKNRQLLQELLSFYDNNSANPTLMKKYVAETDGLRPKKKDILVEFIDGLDNIHEKYHRETPKEKSDKNQAGTVTRVDATGGGSIGGIVLSAIVYAVMNLIQPENNILLDGVIPFTLFMIGGGMVGAVAGWSYSSFSERREIKQLTKHYLRLLDNNDYLTKQ